jgi:alkylation response protein AidB-like acyl-CoA dehydrogenase
MTTDNSDRHLLAETMARIVAAHAPLSNVEKVVATDLGHDPSVWQRIVELGATALLVPEAAGGLGQSLAEGMAVSAELGRAVVPGPYASSAVAATTLLAALPEGERRTLLLERLSEGDVTAAVVDATSVALDHDNGRWRLDGEVAFVPDAATADVLVVHAPGLVVVLDAAAVDVTPTPMSDQTRRLATVRLSGIQADPAAVLSDDAETVAVAVHRARLAFELALAADAVGGAEAVLGIAVEYAKTREQFDRPIGSFQAIKHKLADMHVLVESAKAIVAEAADAWSVAGEGPAPELVTRAAVAFATSTYVSVAGDAIQVHGGIGFTWEHPCHRFLKRAWLDQALVGGPAGARAAFGEAVIARALA